MNEKVNTGALRYLGNVSGRTKGNIAVLTLIQAVLGLSSIFYALFLQDIVNAAVDGDRQTFFANIIKFIVLVAVQLTLRAIVRYMTELTRSTLENRMKARLFDTLLEKDYASVTAVHSGDWMNRLTADTQLAADGMTNLLPSLVGMVVRLVGAIVVIAMLDLRLLYIIIPAGILLILVSTSFRKVMKRLHKAIRERDGNLRVQMQETLESMLVVRSFGVEDEMSDEAEEKMSEHKAARMKRNRFSNFCTTGFGAIMLTATVLGVALCGYGILTGSMTYGTFVAVLTLIGQIRAPFQNISGFLPQFYAMLASAERLMEAEQLPEGESGETESLSDIKKRYDAEVEGIGLEKVSFTYPAPFREANVIMPATLSDVNLNIKKGEYVALVGPSGCGKSTLLKLMMCLYTPDCGERYIILEDQTDDHLTHREPLDTRWHRLFAYVPQENQFMSGTIREVVAFPDRKRMEDDERIWQALRTACAEEFVSNLEDGLDTLLGERGLGLSEGQLQRLAVARAVFSENPVLMLDECTSALDSGTERRLLERLQEMTDRTVLIVTHRTAALEICDKVVEFAKNGCVVRENV